MAANKKSRVDTDALFKNLTGQTDVPVAEDVDVTPPPLAETVVEQKVAPAEPIKRVSRKSAPAGYKPNPEYLEIRNRRVHLLLLPSLYEKLKQEAARSEVSVNELVNSILETRYR